MELNNDFPLAIELAATVVPLSTTEPVGGGARVRMKLANADASSSTAESGVAAGLDVSSGYPPRLRFRQFDGSPVRSASSPGSGRSCVNSRLEIPISTL